MGQSLKARFNGNTREVIEYTKAWGRSKAMDKYEVRDYVAFSKFIEEVSGDAHIGINPTLDPSVHTGWAEQLLDAFLVKIHRLETENVRLKEEIHKSDLEIEYYKGSEAMTLEPKITEIMALCGRQGH